MKHDPIPDYFGNAGIVARIYLEELKNGISTVTEVRNFAGLMRAVGNNDLADEIEKRLPN